jgi:uncharacterized protein YbjT (DUF2867 family)
MAKWLRPVFMDLAAETIAASGTLRLPFGAGRTSPVAARDVAEVIAAVLMEPGRYVGQVIELTGPQSVDLDALAREYSSALGRPVAYAPITLYAWTDDLKRRGIPDHLYGHLPTMARLRAANRYDRRTDSVERILGRPATSMAETVHTNRQLFEPSR